MSNSVYLSLGSNIGDRFYNLLAAIAELDKLPKTKVAKVSKFYETEPWGYQEQEYFINCAVELRTDLLPYELLKSINHIEDFLKRRRMVKWGPRTIDIDIIFYSNLNINTAELCIPHPMYTKRNFVLLPLMDIYYDKKQIARYLNVDLSSLKEYSYNKPILVSSCLMGVPCNYMGKSKQSCLFSKVLKNLQYVQVCPEVLGGLSTPRPPAERIGKRVVTAKGCDVTNSFIAGANKTLEIAKKNRIEIAILKEKSPSCGYGRIYDGSFTSILVDGNGVTVDLLLENGINIISI